MIFFSLLFSRLLVTGSFPFCLLFFLLRALLASSSKRFIAKARADAWWP